MTLKKYTVSVVIPSYHNFISVEKCIYAVSLQDQAPLEIIVVDSFLMSNSDINKLKNICKNICKFYFLSSEKKLNPGAARNIGINKASGDYIAFIDIMTIPRVDWLSSCLRKVHADIVWGSTIYVANDIGLMPYVRDAVYGIDPIRTLPGSLIRKNVFHVVGVFLENVRTGEDSEWMSRAKYFDLASTDSDTVSVDYYGLLNLDFKGVVLKWIVSYRSSGGLEYYKWQRLVILFVVFPYFIFIAYAWNGLITGWQVNSLFYVPHITKVVAIIPFMFYFFYRGVFLPREKGLKLFPNIFPLRFVMLFIIGMILDAVKVYAFLTMHKLKRPM